MRKLAVIALTSALISGVSSGALAQDEAPQDEIRRDPEGITGISPYMEAVAKGREAFIAGDHAAAVGAFDEAITEDRERVLAYLLKAQTQLEAGNRAAASATAQQANGKKGTETEQSKLIFLQAELGERAANTPKKDEPLPTEEAALKKALHDIWDTVKQGWSAYSSFVAEHGGAPNYSASAQDRQKKVDARIKRETDYGAVRSRADNK